MSIDHAHIRATFDPNMLSSVRHHLFRLSARPALAEGARSYGTRRESKPWRQRPNRKAKLAVILTEDVPKLGRRGQLVRVEHGYGRNWLLPQKKAVYTTPDNMQLYGVREEEQDSDNEADVAAFVRNVFAKHSITLAAPVDSGEDWSLHEHHIAKELRRFRLHVPPDCIQLASPLTSIGAHPAALAVDENTEIQFTVTVVQRTAAHHSSTP